MSNEPKGDLSSYGYYVTLIDTLGPMIANLLKQTEKNSKEIEEIKTMLKRITN